MAGLHHPGCSCMGRGSYPFYHPDYPGFVNSICLIITAVFCSPCKTCLHGHICDQPAVGHLQKQVCDSDDLIYCHLAFTVEPRCKGEGKSSFYLHSHIIVVLLFFGPCIFRYTCPPTTFPTGKMVSIFHTIGTPF